MEQVDAATVGTINLRTYGWAEQTIFGTSEHVVRAVHQAATADATMVPRPRVPVIHNGSAP